jgi:hypothetical protein
MDGTRAIAAALFLCVASIGGVVVADTSGSTDGMPQTTTASDGSMVVFAADNTSGYLVPRSEDIDRTDNQATGLDVAAAVEADAGSLERAHDRSTLERRHENADSIAERQAIVERGVEGLTSRIDSLSEREKTAIQQYNDGEIETRELLWTLAVVYREAEQVAITLEWLETTADDSGADAAAERVAIERVRLVSMRGPVRATLADAVSGGDTIRIHVETADTGLVLATVDSGGDTYLREAHDPSAKTTDVGDQYEGNPSPALERFSTLYPWATDHFDAIDALGTEQVRLYRFSSTHPHGELETYLDSGSEEILHERQRIEPADVPSRTIARTEGDRRLVVNATRAGGPLGLSVVDATTAEPVDAEIAVNGDPIGPTDGDRIWTVAPRGSAMINATSGGETVTVEATFG